MNKRIDSLNGLRFIFMIFLFVHHLDAFYDLEIPGYWNIMKIFGEGYISVDFFFVLSGFLLTYSYQSKLQNNEITSSKFMFNRIAKLWPTHALIWIIVVILYSGGTQYFIMNLKTQQFWTGLFLLQSLIPVDYFALWGNGAAWTMSTLMCFYVAFCFVAKMTYRQKKAIFLSLLGVVLLNCIVIGNNTPVSIWLYVNNPLFRLPEFLAGSLICDWIRSKNIDVSQGTATKLQLASVLIMAWFIGFSIFYVSKHNPKFQSFYYLLPCAFLIATFSLNKGLLSSLLSGKAFGILGDSSFAFYLAHQPVLAMTRRYFGENIHTLGTMVAYSVGAFVVSVILSVLIHYFFERPLNLYLRRVTQSKSS